MSSNQEHDRGNFVKDMADLEHDETYVVNEYKFDGTGAKSGWPYGPERGDELAEPDMVNHPRHYQIGKYEVIDVIEEWFPNDPHLFTAAQYIARAPHKGQFRQDLEKAIWYIKRRLGRE